MQIFKDIYDNYRKGGDYEQFHSDFCALAFEYPPKISIFGMIEKLEWGHMLVTSPVNDTVEWASNLCRIQQEEGITKVKFWSSKGICEEYTIPRTLSVNDPDLTRILQCFEGMCYHVSK
jgi:hypothetical protein